MISTRSSLIQCNYLSAFHARRLLLKVFQALATSTFNSEECRLRKLIVFSPVFRAVFTRPATTARYNHEHFAQRTQLGRVQACALCSESLIVCNASKLKTKPTRYYSFERELSICIHQYFIYVTIGFRTLNVRRCIRKMTNYLRPLFV